MLNKIPSNVSDISDDHTSGIWSIKYVLVDIVEVPIYI